MYKKSLFIFRRDLRLEDNLGLIQSLQNSTEVIPCFIYDENIIKNVKDSKFRWNFLNESLTDLDNELKKKGAKLQILEGKPEKIIEKIIKENKIESIFVNTDFTNYSQYRDEKIYQKCKKNKISFHSTLDFLLHNPKEIKTNEGTPYTIYSFFYKKYKDRVGEIVTGEVYQVWKKEILILDDEGNELLLPKSEQIPNDYFKKGDNVRGVIENVELKGNKPQIIMSRTAPEFLEKLFEQEIPEVFDGLITIKKVVRIPGEKAKVAVDSYDDRIDPVGACVGMKGSRIHGIVRELGNENIDVINFTSNAQLYITRALSPAKVSTVKINEEAKTAEVFLKIEEVSKAIGRGGNNIKLASLLTGYEIDVIREGIAQEEDDVELREFSDEIEAWIIEEFEKIGLDTARSVLNQDVADLVRRTDLEEETILDVMNILKEELEG